MLIEITRPLDINVKALYTVSQEFGKRLLALGRPGKVINIASYIAQEDISVYASSKAFVRMGLPWNPVQLHQSRVSAGLKGLLHSRPM